MKPPNVTLGLTLNVVKGKTRGGLTKIQTNPVPEEQTMEKLAQMIAPLLEPYGIHPEDFIDQCVAYCIERPSGYGNRPFVELPCIEDAVMNDEELDTCTLGPDLEAVFNDYL